MAIFGSPQEPSDFHIKGVFPPSVAYNLLPYRSRMRTCRPSGSEMSWLYGTLRFRGRRPRADRYEGAVKGAAWTGAMRTALRSRVRCDLSPSNPTCSKACVQSRPQRKTVDASINMRAHASHVTTPCSFFNSLYLLRRKPCKARRRECRMVAARTCIELALAAAIYRGRWPYAAP